MNQIEIMRELLAQLKKKAKEATPGPWECNAEFIAAANPSVVLALVAEIERLEQEANWLAQELAKFCSRADCDECEYVGQQWEKNTFCKVLSLGVNSPDTWREAARKAVEEQ